MTTKQFLAIEKRLLRSLPGFVIKGTLLLVRPLDHTLRGFHFEPSAFSEEAFYVGVFFMPLCVPTQKPHFTFAHRLSRREGWSLTQPDLDKTLRSEMLKEVPFVLGLKTADDVVMALQPFTRPNQSGYVNPYCYEAFAYSLLRAGRPEEAAAVIDKLLEGSNSEADWEQEIRARAHLIRKNLPARLEEAGRQLNTWETETVHNLGLDAFISDRLQQGGPRATE